MTNDAWLPAGWQVELVRECECEHSLALARAYKFCTDIMYEYSNTAIKQAIMHA